MTRPESRREITDVRVLSALGHPVRVQLLSYLLETGPRTATQCAEVVDASPSACSYHLRHMARFGLVERVDLPAGTPRGDGRERPWQASSTGYAFGGAPSTESPAINAARHAVLVAGIDDNARLAKRYLADADELSAEWRDAGGFASYGLLVAADELAAFSCRPSDAALAPVHRRHPGGRP